MNQAVRIVITGQEGIRLTISLDSSNAHQESRITDKAIKFYKSLGQQPKEVNESAKSFNEEETFSFAFDEDTESEGVKDRLEDDAYLYNDLKYK